VGRLSLQVVTVKMKPWPAVAAAVAVLVTTGGLQVAAEISVTAVPDSMVADAAVTAVA
jgi:hypothetical protein